MKNSRIHTMESLEKEILRLQLHQKDSKHQLEKQWDKMRHHWGAMLINSFRKPKDKPDEHPGIFETLMKNEKVESTIHAFTDKISGKVSELIGQLLEKFFKK